MVDVGPYYELVPKDLDANLAFRRDLLRQAGEDPKVAAQLRTMCAEDLLFHVNTFCWTYDPRAGKGKSKVVPFVLYEFQVEAILSLLECVEEGEDAAVTKSRDMGASWIGLTLIEWLWHFRAHLSFLLVSRNEDYVDKKGNPKALFWKIDFLHQHMPRWLLPTGRWLGEKDPKRKLLSLVNADNGSVIDGESTTGDAGRGDRRTAMFIDEYAAFDMDAGFKVLRATRDTTNCRIFNSTPQGANNAFAEVVHKTAARVIRLHWSAHPDKARGAYTTDEKTGKVILLDDFRGMVTVKRKGKPSKVVRFPEDYPFELDQESPKVRSPWYDHQCSRCVSLQEVGQELDIDFLGSSYPFFDPRFILLLKKRYVRKPVASGDVEYDHKTLKPKRWVPHPKGMLKLWIELNGDERPPKNMEFTLGADISAGTGASNSVISIADKATGEKVAVLRTPDTLPKPFARLAMAIGRFFNNAYIVHDASGPTGGIFTKELLKEGYPNFYRRRYEKKLGQKVSEEPGYALNAVARAELFEDYRSALSDHRFINRSETGLDECLQFIRRPDGGIEHSASASAQDPSGARTAHGDEVVADALACLGVYETRSEEEAEQPTAPVGSLAWRREQEAQQQLQTAGELGPGW